MKRPNTREKFISLINLAESGNEDAFNSLDKMLGFLSMGITNLVNLYNPEFIIVGGMGEKLPKRYLDILIGKVKNKAFKTAFSNLIIMKSVIDVSNSSLLGCTLMAMDNFASTAIL